MKSILSAARAIPLVLMSVCATVPVHDAAAQTAPARTLNVGDDAPPLAVSRWLKGGPIDGLRKGEVYVLDFWAVWCVPCRESMPHLSQLAREYKGKATFIAMNVWEIRREGRDLVGMVDAFVNKMGDKLDVNVAMDTDGNATANGWLKAAGIGSIPTAIIVDRQGKIAWIGGPQGLEKTLESVVSGTFDRQAAATVQASRPARQRGGGDEASMAAMAAYTSIQQAIKAKDYKLALALYDKTIAANPAFRIGAFERLRSVALAHADPDKAYSEVMAAKGSSREYELASAFVEEEGLERRFYDYVTDYFTRRSEVDPFAMGRVAAASFLAGDAGKAVAIQKAYLEDLKGPTSPSTDGFIKREEENLKKYQAAMEAQRASGALQKQPP